MGTAGSAVIFAGLTVMIAVCGLSLVGIDFLAVMGFASAISVLFAVLAALTLLPALISIFHKSIKIKDKPSKSKDPKDHPWAKFIVGKPVIAVIVSLIILILAAIPVSGMRLGIPDDSLKPTDSSEYKAYKLISDNFGEGYNGQIVMLVNTKDGGSKSTIERDLNNMRSDLEDIDNVDTVSKAQLTDNNNYALFTIIPEKGPNSQSTENLVYDLRDYHSQAQENMTMTLKFQDKVLLTSICQKTKQRYSSICRRYRCISILLINDCVPFNLSSIKSSIRLYSFINGYIRFHNISHSTWLYG